MELIWHKYSAHVLHCPECSRAYLHKPTSERFGKAQCAEGEALYSKWRSRFYAS